MAARNAKPRRRSLLRAAIVIPAIVALVVIAGLAFLVARSTRVDDAVAKPATIGSGCVEPGATGTTADGANAYCSNLEYTNGFLWSINPGTIDNPVLTSQPSAPPDPADTESPIQVCMKQTGHGRLRCAKEILRGNAPAS